MAAGSQYHRGAIAPHSHYHLLPGNHEPPCADLATSWNSSQGASHLSRASAGSALLHRLSSPAHLPPAHYLDYGGSSDYVNPNPPSTPSQPQWAQNYPPPASQGWSHAFSESSFTPRSLSYGAAENRQPVPHLSPPPTRRFENTTPQDSTTNGYLHQETRHKPHGVADPAVPPPFPAETPTLAPILNYANPDLHVASSHAPSQEAITWAPEPSSGISPDAQQHAFSHTAHALHPAAVLGNQGPLPGSAWAMVSSGPSNLTSTVYEQLPGAAPTWDVETNPQNVPIVLAYSAPRATTLTRGRRSQSSKITTKVPAAFVARAPKSKVSKRRGPLPEASRAKTHHMRKEKKVCLRCKFYKAGCDHGDPCQRCCTVRDGPGARSFTVPCIRDRLEDTMLVRHCNGRSNQVEGEFLTYDFVPDWKLRNIDIIWNLPGTSSVQLAPLRIMVGQYRPKRALLDSAANEWSTTEGRVVVQQPPYAVYDTQNLVPAFEKYVSNVLQSHVERWIFERVSHDEIALLTYHEVARLRATQPPGPGNLLDIVMRLQCFSVVSQGYGTVVSQDVPGIREYDYSKMGRSQYEAYDRNSRDRPLPGAISQQIDVTALKLLKRLESQCYKALDKRILKSKIRPWYELYLALYVILWNMEYIHRSAETYMLSKNGTTVENHVRNVVSDQLKKWKYSFEILMYYWSAAVRDYRPFRLARENPTELRLNGHLDSEGFDYVMKVTHIADRMGGIGQSTVPYRGPISTHNSFSSERISKLLESVGL